MVSFYDVLQVDQTATSEAIRQAFKRRALQVHPDKGGSPEAFHLVYEALETLSDPEGSGRGSGTPRDKSGPVKFVGARQLLKIHTLLKKLPRELRLEVIQKEFSQQQRVLLEEWMVTRQRTEEHTGPAEDPRYKTEATDKGNCCDTLALSTHFNPGQPVRHATKQSKARRRIGVSNMRGISSAGKTSHNYRAAVHFDYVNVYARDCDLPTAVDYLLILTSTRQKMLSCGDTDGTFEERMEKALLSSAKEQGRPVEELKLSFAVRLHVSFFTGPAVMRSPIVKTLKDLQKMRSWMEPFRGSKHIGKNAFWYFSPAELTRQWEELASAWTKMCQSIPGFGRNEKHLRTVRAWYAATEKKRQRALCVWEQGHMASEDQRNPDAKLWMRRKRRAKGHSVSGQLVVLRSLLASWRNILDLELQRKKERQRLQQKRLRIQQARAKREALRKRMRDPNLTMDDILGHASEQQRAQVAANRV
eukprot:Skav231078  [mRNA]  locus=scaffold524:379437:380946:- [translate_table: standard]